MRLRLRWWSPLWRLAHDDLVEWTGGNDYLRGRFDGWLRRNGLPPGRELAAGSICAVTDRRGRPWLVARRLDGRQVRGRLLEAPPARLSLTAPDVRK